MISVSGKDDKNLPEFETASKIRFSMLPDVPHTNSVLLHKTPFQIRKIPARFSCAGGSRPFFTKNTAGSGMNTPIPSIPSAALFSFLSRKKAPEAMPER